MEIPPYIYNDLVVSNAVLKEARVKGDADEVARAWARIDYLLERISAIRDESS